MNAKTILAAIVVAGAALAGALQASAMPVGPASPIGAIEHVAFGCGPYRHPDGFGRCVPNMRPRYVRPMYRRPPPRRWHRDRDRW